MIIQRRKFLTGLASLLAAPAIIPASNLMKIKGNIVDLNSISMRLITDYKIDGEIIDSLDILYGYLHIQPEWVVDL